MYKRIHTYDLDGVLVDTSHRYRTLPDGSIDLDYWLANRTEEKIANDKLLPLHKQYLIDNANPETYTIICTARQYHPLDIAFIFGYLGAPDKLIMRPVGNMEPDSALKFKQLRALFNLRQFQKLPRKFWDDNPANLIACNSLFDNLFHVASEIYPNA